MKPINSTGSINQQDAVNRAQNSHKAADAARIARDERNDIREMLKDWKGIFINSPISVITSLFVFAVLMEIIFSFPMYMDLMSQMLGKGNPALALIGALFIVLWGAYASHLLAKQLSPSVFKYTVYNVMRHSKGTLPLAAAEEKAHAARKSDFFKGLVLAVILLAVVAVISWLRSKYVEILTGVPQGFTHKLLPSLCVLIEIISGIYIGYIIRRFFESLRARRLNKKFMRQRDICAYETKMAHAHYKHASEIGELVEYVKDLRDVEYRFEHRTIGQDNYVDPIPELKTLKVVVADENGPLQGAHMAGILANREYCNSVYTNQDGEGTLSWEGEERQVMAVYINNEQFNGPFRENATIRIDVKTVKQIKAA